MSRVIVLFFVLASSMIAVNSPDQQPSTSQQLAACLYVNGQPVFGETVYWQTTVSAGSGYHNHFVNRPKGSFNSPTGNEFATSVTGFDGCAMIYWYAPAAAGAHGILAYAGLGGTTSLNINVWTLPFTGWLFELSPNSNYQLVGETADHPSNHFGTGNVVLAIPLIMQQFKSQTGLTGAINDMSVGWGGTFDLGPSYATSNCPVSAAQYWTNSCVHAEHRTGTNVDVPYANLGSYTQLFKGIAIFYGGADGGLILDEGNHFHLRFAY